MFVIKENDIVLFQGDSVTDCGRSRDNLDDLGMGYPMMVASQFSAIYPELNVKFKNRGISGNRVIDLKNRWKEDCLDLKPSVVSILIGINDCWRRYDSNDPTSVDEYKENYRLILTDIKEKLDANIIMLEPFVLPFPEDRKQWRVDLDPKIHAVRELAREFQATLIPLDGIFAEASVKKESSFWTPDGVHPTQAGHGLIAKRWLEAVGVK